MCGGCDGKNTRWSEPNRLAKRPGTLAIPPAGPDEPFAAFDPPAFSGHVQNTITDAAAGSSNIRANRIPHDFRRIVVVVVVLAPRRLTIRVCRSRDLYRDLRTSTVLTVGATTSRDRVLRRVLTVNDSTDHDIYFRDESRSARVRTRARRDVSRIRERPENYNGFRSAEFKPSAYSVYTPIH